MLVCFQDEQWAEHQRRKSTKSILSCHQSVLLQSLSATATSRSAGSAELAIRPQYTCKGPHRHWQIYNLMRLCRCYVFCHPEPDELHQRRPWLCLDNAGTTLLKQTEVLTDPCVVGGYTCTEKNCQEREMLASDMSGSIKTLRTSTGLQESREIMHAKLDRKTLTA